MISKSNKKTSVLGGGAPLGARTDMSRHPTGLTSARVARVRFVVDEGCIDDDGYSAGVERCRIRRFVLLGSELDPVRVGCRCRTDADLDAHRDPL